jgi:fatty acid desaturase
MGPYLICRLHAREHPKNPVKPTSYHTGIPAASESWGTLPKMERPETSPSSPSPGVRGLLSRDEIRAFHRVSVRAWVRDSVAVWAVILGALWLHARFPGYAMAALAFVVIASRQLALSHLVHEAAHYNLGLSREWNDRISDWLFAGPVLITTRSYRSIHEPHHANLGHADRDTDVRAWYLIAGWHFLIRSAKSLFGIEALETARSYGNRMGDGGVDWRHPLIAGATNLLLLAYCVGLGIPFAWLTLWILPLNTLMVFLLILRVVAEHQPREYSRRGREDFSQDLLPPLTRSIDPNPLEKFLLAPMSFCYHHEHHLFPGVPYPQLRRLYRTLRGRGYYDDDPASLGSSYARVLVSLIFPGRSHPEVATTDGAVRERGAGLSGL